MNRRLISILFFAFAIALGCSYVVWKSMTKNMNSAKPIATSRVAAASGDVKIGTVLTASNVKTIEIAGAAPKGAILKPEGAVGRTALAQIFDGEALLESRLSAPGSGGGMAPLIPPGMRACAVKVDDVVGVAGFVTPGMRVDVLASGIPTAANGQPMNTGAITQTILQNIQVLSAGADFQKDAEGKAKPVQVVNLLVTPEQAQALSLASTQMVKLQLVLRNPLDTKVEKVRGTSMNTLFSGEMGSAPSPAASTGARKARKAPAQTYSVEVINGSKRSEQTFAVPEGRP